MISSASTGNATEKPLIDLYRNTMEEEGLDAVVFLGYPRFHTRHVRALTNWFVPWLPSVAILGNEGEPILLVTISHLHAWAREVVGKTELRLVDFIGGDLGASLVEAVSELLPSGSRVGLSGWAHASQTLAVSTERALAGTYELVPCDSAFDELRMVKTTPEIDRIRAALTVVDAQWAAIVARARTGSATEADLKAAADHAAAEAGAELCLTEVASGALVGRGLKVHADRIPIQAGAQVFFALLTRHEGYWGHVFRNAVAGRARSEHLRMLAACNEAFDAMTSSMQPGVPVQAVAEAGERALEEHGFDKRDVRFGGGLGHRHRWRSGRAPESVLSARSRAPRGNGLRRTSTCMGARSGWSRGG